MTKHAPHHFFNPIFPALPSAKYQPFDLLILFLLEKSAERRSKWLARIFFRRGLGPAQAGLAFREFDGWLLVDHTNAM
jgi:hypothetical protein